MGLDETLLVNALQILGERYWIAIFAPTLNAEMTLGSCRSGSGRLSLPFRVSLCLEITGKSILHDDANMARCMQFLDMPKDEAKL